MERLLTEDPPPLTCEAWRRMQRWYISAVDHTLPPARITLDYITDKRLELYRVVTSLVENIPTSVPPSKIDNSIPSEEEVKWAVQRLWGNWSVGPYHMCTKHLWEWLQEHWAQEAA